MVFNLDEFVERPLIHLDNVFKGCTALIDTGALIPLWTKDEQVLVEDLGAVLIKKDYSFKGFGGDATGNLYRINLKLGDIFFPNMPIVACENNAIPGYFLFSATMFSKMDIEVKNSSKEFVLHPLDNQKCFNIVIGDVVLAQ